MVSLSNHGRTGEIAINPNGLNRGEVIRGEELADCFAAESVSGRGEWIRTTGLYVPNVAR